METLAMLKEARQGIIRKEAEIESIFERLEALETTDIDDVHRAKTKLRHEKERLVELKCKATEHEIKLLEMGYPKNV
tara:strand:- start:10709 stop:10939 length:231 start_codon:yes stop_codon:yes gene_type:complete